MAVGAAAVEILDGAKRLRLRWVAAGVMAGIANTRHARLQQLRVAGAMRLVAVRAVLHYRRVLPEEGTAPFGVAAQAVTRQPIHTVSFCTPVFECHNGAGQLDDFLVLRILVWGEKPQLRAEFFLVLQTRDLEVVC